MVKKKQKSSKQHSSELFQAFKQFEEMSVDALVLLQGHLKLPN